MTNKYYEGLKCLAPYATVKVVGSKSAIGVEVYSMDGTLIVRELFSFGGSITEERALIEACNGAFMTICSHGLRSLYDLAKSGDEQFIEAKHHQTQVIHD